MRRGDRRGLTLVRPDGYVAYAARDADLTALRTTRSVLSRQLNAPAKAA